MFDIDIGSIYLSDRIIDNPIPPGFKSDVSSESQPTRPKILIVDDERRIVDTLVEILRKAGFEVMSAYDGWAALEAATRFHPDCLLSDVLMPSMNGVELAVAIRKLLPAARIVLFSGQAGISDILASGQQSGLVFELIAKPIHPLKLIDILLGHK